MVDKMMKYSFILLSSESEAFLEQLQELGVVDITRSTKPIDEPSAAKFEKILKVRRTIGILEALDYSKDEHAAEISAAAGNCVIQGCKSENTLSAVARLDALKGEISAADKLIRQLNPWGEFDSKRIEELQDRGIDLHFYCVPAKSWDSSWEENWPVQRIYEDSSIYFVVPSLKGEEYSFPIAECARPSMSVA